MAVKGRTLHGRILDAEHRIAVVDILIQHLRPYCGLDGQDPKKLVIESCRDPRVSKGAVKAIIQHLVDLKEDLTQEHRDMCESNTDYGKKKRRSRRW